MSALSPTPIHLIRAHTSSVSSVSISDDNERIYSGDSAGIVVITSTRSLRSLASWNAHTDNILGVEEWGDQLITHARDNKLHVWKLPIKRGPTSLGGSAALPGLPTPELLYSLDVNALNYCRFSLLVLKRRNPSEPETGQALIAVPNLVESSMADIWALPSKQRLHAAIGKTVLSGINSADGRGSRNSTGIIMSMHLLPTSNTDDNISSLRLLASYESGSVMMWEYKNTSKPKSIEGIGWECLWTVKLHVESVMAMALSRDHTLALSVSADPIISRYQISVCCTNTNATSHRTKHPGNGSVAIRGDARVCAIGGWDGKIRLYSTKSFKPLGTLRYHKDSVQALAWAHSPTTKAQTRTQTKTRKQTQAREDEDEIDEGEKEKRGRWLISGGKDGRVAIWELMDFGGERG
ncbi:WD40 repeat-like protein [Stereum hirsutum FP-91666 SS1]|uniref:WD40 repeat-like protein n=1 Tax=Stereum hirsutum (strain FP-91666) TaxID=721885 RepID=UPI000440AA2E|nr:WD40 repeat-like protein [Stereum hirsutum FP-91666 SS1]EIM90838.1 WD40 repeat-like protein [Stereum hirsutum FP-91666 SS1]